MTWYHEQIIVAADGVYGDDLGLGYWGCVALSLDGDTIIGGAEYTELPGPLADAGAAYVFMRDSSNHWTEQQKLTASDAAASDYFGMSLSHVGDEVAIGSLCAPGGLAQAGAVYTFTRTAGAWTQQQKLVASDVSAGASLGTSVQISPSGTILLACASYADGLIALSTGAVYVFDKTGGTWTESQKIMASDGDTNDEFGLGLAFISDTEIAISSPMDDANRGSVYIFIKVGGVWTEQYKFTGSDSVAGDYFGNSVKYSDDVVAVSIGANGSAHQFVYIFTKVGGVWTEQQKVTGSDTVVGDGFGVGNMAINNNVLAITSRSDDHALGANAGSVYIFTKDLAGIWTEAQKFWTTHEGGAANGFFGDNVVMDSKSIAVITPRLFTTGVGGLNSAIFVLTETPTFIKRTASDGAASDKFGVAVAANNQTIVSGAYNANLPGFADAGALYAYLCSNGAWTLEQKIVASDPGISNFLGVSVSIDGDTICAGAYGDNGAPVLADQGSAYIFTRTGGTWTQQQKLLASDATTNAMFGYSVSILGDTVLIGAPQGHAGAFADRGAAYIFTRTGGTWTQIAKLIPSDPATIFNFGASVSLGTNVAIIGAYTTQIGAIADQGAAYIFTYSGGVWSETIKLVASDGGLGHQFGNSVAMYGDSLAIVGAQFADAPGKANQGKAYTFRKTGGVWAEEQILEPSDAFPNMSFGTSVAVYNDKILAMSVYGGYEGGLVQTGNVYLFSWDTGTSTWIEEKILVPYDAAPRDFMDGMPNQVAISANNIVLATPKEDSLATDAGAIYILDRVAPVISGQVPAPSAPGISRNSPITFTVTDSDTGIDIDALVVSLSINVGGAITTETAWQNDAAQTGYTGAKVAVSNGYQYTLYRDEPFTAKAVVTINVTAPDLQKAY